MRGHSGFDLAAFQSMMANVFYPLNNSFLVNHNAACSRRTARRSRRSWSRRRRRLRYRQRRARPSRLRHADVHPAGRGHGADRPVRRARSSRIRHRDYQLWVDPFDLTGDVFQDDSSFVPVGAWA
jgi:hypothetical protein